MEPPACGPGMVTTRVTETHSSSWKIVPSFHTCSFSLPEEGITATGFRGHGHSPGLGWLRGVAAVQAMGRGGRTDLREAGEKTKPKPAPWLYACPAIQGHSMESALSHQSFQMFQDAFHNFSKEHLQSSQLHAHTDEQSAAHMAPQVGTYVQVMQSEVQPGQEKKHLPDTFGIDTTLGMAWDCEDT